MRVTIEQVTNGFIVKVLHESAFKESYNKPVMVFATLKEVLAYLERMTLAEKA